eukprot:jgi/Psemu1/50009/gm1.50009_g
MDIPNSNVDSDADSNISQTFLSDDDRKPSSAQKDPPAGDTSAKKKTPNLGSALFSHQKNNTDFSSSSPDNNAIIENPPNDKKAPPTNKTPNKKAPPNPREEARKALLMKNFSYTRAIKNTFLTQTIKYLDQIEKEFDGATDQYIEQMEAVAVKARQTKQKKAKSVASSKGDRPQDFIVYDSTKGDTFPCPKCGHMMVMQLDTVENIAAYNHKPIQSIGSLNLRVSAQAKKSQVQGAEVAKAVVVGSVTVNPKELEEDTAPKTMPGLVSMVHDSIAEATCPKFLEDTTATKQDITCNACSSVFFQMASNPHIGSAKFQKAI